MSVSVLDQLKVDENMYFDTWADVASWVEEMRKMAEFASRAFKAGPRPSPDRVMDPEGLMAMMGEVERVLSVCSSGLKDIERRHAGRQYRQRG